MVEQKLPERAVSLFMKACEVAEVGPFTFFYFLVMYISQSVIIHDTFIAVDDVFDLCICLHALQPSIPSG